MTARTMDMPTSTHLARIPRTQHEAFDALTPQKLSPLQQMVMDCFRNERTLLTREDIAARTNMRLSSVCGRVRELLDAELLAVRDVRKDLATQHRQQLLGLPVA